jgi:spermidine/putrescine transport system ATP-binding protein
MTSIVSLHSVQQQFGNFVALENLNLEIEAGEFLVLLGPSGCGKSTLLFILGGFLAPTSGQVLIGGKDMSGVPPKSRPTTTMFQDYALFPHMSLRDNVAFGLRMKGQNKKTRNIKADEMLDMVGLADKANHKPHELSGGQRQRIALARALAVDPEVLLLDEPLGALDMKLRRQMQEELKAIQRKVGTTFVHVTHDQEEAMAIADRIVVMNYGKIEDIGPPQDIYLKPNSLFSANFMGEMNIVPMTVEKGKAVTPFGIIPVENIPENPQLCIRPENIGLTGEFEMGPAILESSSFFGTYHRCHFRPVAHPDTELVVHLPLGEVPEVLAEVKLFGSNAVLLSA